MESNPPAGGGGQPPHEDPNHMHHAGCGCAEEMKKQDPHGQDLYELIDKEGI